MELKPSNILVVRNLSSVKEVLSYFLSCLYMKDYVMFFFEKVI